ncbi:hypothetical protein B0A79_23835 [Flavobacterium piscis]|uniref:DNA-binding protein n=1 Tax=Flavobacterium piscis TaxID=1114874 RepID=A0ABX2XJU6_9FLAO|nr:hypothetical protein [Flavobacterium piscis]OCB75547.1 hypothetical protein FLP_08760 [Flavobacterium piscis]OXE95923.1 hypothetical protein B0A79_23835 [Flavobacterium piscis]
MSKNTTKNYNSYDAVALEALYVKYGLSKFYIRQSINGKVVGITPDAIKKDYKSMVIENQKTVKNLIDKTR